MSTAMSKPDVTLINSLADFMKAAGVVNAPAWFETIKLPNNPFPHQIDMLTAYVNHVRYGDFSDPGCCKTFPAQAHAVLMAALGNKVVFTMPPRLIRQFEAELKDFFTGINKHLEVSHLDVGAVQKSKRIARWDKEGWPDILLISYDAFRQFNDLAAMKVVPRNQWKREDGVTSYWVTNADRQKVPWEEGAQAYSKHCYPVVFRRGKAKAENPNRMRLKKVGYSVYFFDEAHALCNPESIVWRAVQHLDGELKDEVALYLMTGTPIPTHLENVYGLIKLLNRDAYFSSSNFERKHCILNPDSPHKQIVDYKNEEDIYVELYRYAKRVQKRDVLKDLKDPLITATPIVLKGRHKRLYDQILSERFAVLGDNVLTPDNDTALRMLALQIITCPDEFDTTGEIGKDNEVAKWLDQMIDMINPTNHKVIVFAFFKNTVNFLAKRLAQWNPAVMNGATSKGWAEVERFKHDDSCRVFVVNWGSGGAGLNLQVSHHSIFYEIPTSPKDAKQAIARTDRQGQKYTPNVYFPKVVGTLLDRNFKNLLKNERSNNKAVKDVHDLLYQQLKVTKLKAA